MDSAKEKKFAASLSVFSNITLILLKITAGVMSGSISIISEAIHSLGDLLAAGLAYFAVSKSSDPADEEHPFGHGKFEELSGLAEGFLIIAVSFFIIYKSVIKIISGNHEIVNMNLGLAVMIFASAANFIVSRHLFKTAEKTDSVALYADGEHLRTDVYSSLAVAAGLLAIKITGVYILDPLIAIVVAVIIFKAGFDICKNTAANLLDVSLSPEDKKIIAACIETHRDRGVRGYKELQTRKAGSNKKIQVKIFLNPGMTIAEGHKICDSIEAMIERKLENSTVVIHIEPGQ
ncbi:MAG: cation diffusion facilitator family transporter [Elusimicrobium sp.]|jgi:cation diffusion facilitator family transporter|nr:cation diffusion facilitator family transporter [Elusimicrobium sp.]